jgi:hypothetical protein
VHSVHKGVYFYFYFYFLLLVCTFERDINNFEVKVDVRKGALRFRGKSNKRCVHFIQFMLSSIVVIW